jgi:hypothetical protein
MKMMVPSMLAGHLANHAQQRFDRFATTSIGDLFSESDEFLDVSGTLLDFLSEHRKPLCRLFECWLQEIDRHPEQHQFVQFLSYNTKRFLKNNNQFLVLTQTNQNDLAEVYHQFLASFYRVLNDGRESSLATNVIDALQHHRSNLRGFAKSLFTSHSTIGDMRTPQCSEYSPNLQISILHLGGWDVAEPILDIGCGERANLVRHLRSLKLDAFGIDAFASNNEPYLFREDWLTYPLSHGCWGTVLSHMAFSNHFLHHYLKESPAVRDYARRYLEILESLKPNGCFIYTPGLPFIEELLPRDRFHIEVRPIAEARGTRFDEALALLVGSSTFYSTCVRRIL